MSNQVVDQLTLSNGEKIETDVSSTYLSPGLHQFELGEEFGALEIFKR